MKQNKRLVNGLQNTALLLLTASAIFLLLHTPLLDSWSFFSVPAAALASQPARKPAEDLSAMLGPVHIMITEDSDYGRYGQLCASKEDTLVQQIIPIFREALGSAAELEAAGQQNFRDALEGACVYIDFGFELSLAAAAACLGESSAFDRPVRAVALTAGTEDAVLLYLYGEDGSLFRSATALPGSALRAVCTAAAPNGSLFAYETSYTALAPYTLLVPEVRQPPEVQADLPIGYTAYNLLTALDFNAHTNSRYTDWDGAEVVEESPRTLRIRPDGLVVYSNAGTALPAPYQASGGSAALPEALRTAWALASALTEGTGASSLYLHTAEETEAGYMIRFRYQAEGVPVCFTDESDALTVTVNGTAVTDFVYRCRSYTTLEESDSTPAPLLPPPMAAAIATLRSDSGLTIAYVDGGTSRLSPCWLS